VPKTRGESGAAYDPADFVIPAQDHQGHSERLYCRVQPLHDRQVDKVVSSKQFPFRTKGDVMRWCVVRGLKLLETLEPVAVRGFMQQADAIDEMLKDEIYMQEYMQMFEKLQKVVSQHMSMGAQGEATRLIAQTKFRLEQIEGEPHWRQKCLAELDRRFGHMLKQRGVGLDAAHDDTDESSSGSTLGFGGYKQ
jgi:hypothetical protein